jgi:hypothetical protein
MTPIAYKHAGGGWRESVEREFEFVRDCQHRSDRPRKKKKTTLYQLPANGFSFHISSTSRTTHKSEPNRRSQNLATNYREVQFEVPDQSLQEQQGQIGQHGGGRG